MLGKAGGGGDKGQARARAAGDRQLAGVMRSRHCVWPRRKCVAARCPHRPAAQSVLKRQAEGLVVDCIHAFRQSGAADWSAALLPTVTRLSTLYSRFWCGCAAQQVYSPLPARPPPRFSRLASQQL